MTEAVIYIAAIMTLAIAILAALYGIVRHAPPQLGDPIGGTARGTSNKEPCPALGLKVF